MLKTTVYLPDALDSRLAAQATASGVSKAELIRRAVSSLLDSATQGDQPDLPVFDSGRVRRPEELDDEVYAQLKERASRR